MITRNEVPKSHVFLFDVVKVCWLKDQRHQALDVFGGNEIFAQFGNAALPNDDADLVDVVD